MTSGVKQSELLAIDAANGIGAQKLVHFRQMLSNILPMEIFNDGTKGHLNEKVNKYLIKSNYSLFWLVNLVWS